MNMFFTFRRLIGTAIVFFLPLAFLHARPQGEEPVSRVTSEQRNPTNRIPNDPEVQYGVLDNGLTYYVRQNDKPEGFAELQLIVHAGSLQEDDDQLGLAHFLEHMLFNGTKKYPKNELLKKLESFGIQIGPEVNAFTDFTTTTYKLTVSTEDGEQFDTGLDILKEWAFNALLDEEEYEKEREVVHEEWRGQRGAWARMMDQIYPVVFKDSRYAERLPIGNMDVVLKAPISVLQRFYRDWYRPNLMAVIAVGDFDPDATVKKIKELFGDQPNPPNPRPRIEYSIPGHKETYSRVIDDREAERAFDWWYVTFDTPPYTHLVDFKQSIAEELCISMLNTRLEELLVSENPPFLHARSSLFWFSRNTSFANMVANVDEEKALTGMSALLTEIERVRQHGFLQSEFDRTKSEILSRYEQTWKQRDEMDSAYFVSHYASAYIQGIPYVSIDWEWKTLQDILPTITLDEVDDFASVLLQETNRSVFITGPSVPAITGIKNEDIDQVVQNVKEKEISAWEETLATDSLVVNDPQAGHIVERSIVPETDIVKLKLSNGAMVYYKVTDYSSNEVSFFSFSPGGTSLVNDDEYVSAKYAPYIIPKGGLGNYAILDIRKLMSGVVADVWPFIGMEREGMQGQSSTEDLEYLFQLVYLGHTVPRRDETVWTSELKSLKTVLKNRSSNPHNHFADAIFNAMFDGHYRMQPDTVERLAKFNVEDAYAFFRERFRYGGDFTYVFVGDFNPETLERFSEKWLASLPAAPAPENWRDNQVRISKKSLDIEVKAGSEPVSYVHQSWSGVWDGSYEEEYRLTSLGSALEMMLFEILREKFGGTYSVSVFPWMFRQPAPEYKFAIEYSCDPERVEELSAHVLEIIEKWRTTPPERRFVESIVMNQHNNLKKDMNSNDWWVNQIDFVLKSDIDYEIMLNLPDLYDTLSPEMLRETAARYLDDNSYVRVVLFPEKEAAGETGE